jgi:hypothetical protein
MTRVGKRKKMASLAVGLGFHVVQRVEVECAEVEIGEFEGGIVAGVAIWTPNNVCVN